MTDMLEGFEFSDSDVMWNPEEWKKEEVPGLENENIDEEDFLDCLEPSKKSMTIFFLIDTSGSMKGTKIGTVNGTMEELLPELVEVGGNNADISIAALRYATTVTWITKEGPVPVKDYQIWPRQPAGGTTVMGAAFKELNHKLSRKEFMNKPSLSYAPVIFLMSDGVPSDDWQEGLNLLKQNSWYKYGLKIAVGIGSNPNMDVLREFTGRDELAIRAHGAKELRELIEFLVITSSKIGSQSMTLTDEGKELTEEDVAGGNEEQLVEAVKKDIMGEVDKSQDQVDFDAGW